MKNVVYLFLCLCANTAYAKNLLNGKVVGADHKPVDNFYATLLSPNDSSLIAGTAFTHGVFEFNEIDSKNCILKITSFGYTASYQNIEVTEGSTQLPTITLQPNQLTEVTISTRQPVIQSKADRTIISVEGSMLATTLNGMDMLQKTPGLIKDPYGDLVVAGKGTPKYYVDGKEVHAMNEVKMLNPQNIKSIEIIDNPSSAYDAEGHAVVLINTIKRADHYLLNIGGELNQSRRISGNTFIEGALKTGRITSNLYLSRTVNNNKTYDNNYSIISPDNNLDSHAVSTSQDAEYSYRMSVEAEIARNQTLVFQSNGFDMDENKIKRDQYTHFSNPSFRNFNSHKNQSKDEWQINNTLSYTCKLDTLGGLLKVVADYTRGKTQDDNAFYNTLVGNEDRTPFWNNVYNTSQPSIYSIKGDYTKPFSKRLNMDAGVKFYRIIGDNTTNLTGSTNLEQHYKTKEQNLAAYTSLNAKVTDKLELRMGLRGEETFRKAIKDNVAYLNTKRFGLFPSALLNYTYSPSFSTGLSYSKRISRPTFSALDPSLWVDSLTNRVGNPNLLSTDIHSFQLTFKFFGALSVRAGYNYYIHPIYFLVYKDILQPQLTDVRFVNGDNVGRFIASVSYSKQVCNWWSTTFYGTLFTNSYPYVDETNVTRNNNLPGKNASIQNTLNLPKKIVLNLGFQYNGKGSWASIYNEAYWNLHFSLQRSFFNQSLIGTLTVNDLFNTMVSHQHSVLAGQNLNVFDSDERYVGISLKYQIGKSKYNYSSKSENNEERQRIR
jgi:hypothetical protein